MDQRIANIENRIDKFAQEHELKWLVVCGIKNVSYSEMLKILQLLRNEKLYELEAMMIWKMEYLELNEDKM